MSSLKTGSVLTLGCLILAACANRSNPNDIGPVQLDSATPAEVRAAQAIADKFETTFMSPDWRQAIQYVTADFGPGDGVPPDRSLADIHTAAFDGYRLSAAGDPLRTNNYFDYPFAGENATEEVRGIHRVWVRFESSGWKVFNVDLYFRAHIPKTSTQTPTAIP